MVRIALVIFSCLAFAGVISAQVGGELTGSVVDPSGATVADAAVSLYLPGGKTPNLTTHTSTDGVFNFTAVRPDTYKLVIDAPGFTSYTQENIAIDPVHQTSLRPIQLEIRTAAAAVEVVGSVATVDTSSVEVTDTITQSQVLNLPVLDRQINNLFYTQIGVNSNGRTNTDTVIDGLRAQNTNVTLDGVNIQDNFIRINGLDYIPNKLTIGEVAEITISSSNANPTVGGNANAISLSTPSGTNTYHGNLYWYNRNNFFSANDWFNNKAGVARPFLNLNQFGGSIGGPILKDKLLFFANYETYDLHQTSPKTRTILTPTARQGILQYTTNGQVRQFNVLQAAGLNIDPYAQSLLLQIPATGNTTTVGDQLNTTGYQFNALSNERRDSIVGKVDYNLSPRHVFSGTYRWNRDNVDRPDVGNFYTAAPPVFNQNRANLFTVAWRWTPTTTLTNELRGGGNLAQAPFDVTGTAPSFFVSGTLFSNPANTFLPQGRTTHTYNIQDNANWVRGKHAVSFGFQTQQIRVAPYNYGGIVPTYTLGYATTSPYGFSVGQIPGASSTFVNTANNLLQTLAGIVSSASQSYNITSQTSGFVPGAPEVQHLSFNDYAGYVSDNWKALHRLTLVLGVRWDYFPPVNEANSLLIEPQLINNNPVQTLLGNANLNFMGNSVGRPLYHKDLNNFAPNVGFAWDVFGDGKMAIRGGYSIAYAQDDILEAVLTTATANSGIVGGSTLNNINAFTKSPPPLPTPGFQIPITTYQNFLNTADNDVEGLIDPNLRTPYVQQWNFDVQREFKGMIFEGRYIGNHAVKLMRQIDFNQVNVFNGGFLQDFKNAYNNGIAALNATGTFNPAYNAAVRGTVPLPFFSQLPGGGSLTSSSVRTDILSQQVGTLAQLYQVNGYFPKNMPNFTYFPNPYDLYSSELTNYSNSDYNGLQLQVRKRTSSGIQFQAGYEFSKTLSDTSVERGLDALLDNNNPSVEKARAPWDLTHSFKLNHYIPLPFGPGQHFSSHSGFLNHVIGGWAFSGFVTVDSGAPVSILSSLGTLNRGSRSTENTVNTTDTLGQLQQSSGLFMTGNGPYYINPANISSSGQGIAPYGQPAFSGQVFFTPSAGGIGSLQRRILSGPWYKNYNMAISKDTRITERQSIQFRADFYNLFNHANFLVNDQTVTSVNFGQINQMFYSSDGVGPRVIQFGLFYKF